MKPETTNNCALKTCDNMFKPINQQKYCSSKCRKEAEQLRAEAREAESKKVKQVFKMPDFSSENIEVKDRLGRFSPNKNYYTSTSSLLNV